MVNYPVNRSKPKPRIEIVEKKGIKQPYHSRIIAVNGTVFNSSENYSQEAGCIDNLFSLHKFFTEQIEINDVTNVRGHKTRKITYEKVTE